MMTKPIRIAFAGFRHGHILELYDLAKHRPDVQVVAAAEDHPPTRHQLAAGGRVAFTHESCEDLFRHAEFDVLAVGDYYGRRGELLIRGLEAGRHVVADKPLCTTQSELARIKELSDRGRLCVSCMLTMRDSGVFRTLRDAALGGRIGAIHTVTFLGQHPLLRASRPGWYFESPEHHGGTINDIAIHAVDGIPWMTGRKIAAIVAARVWNGGLAQPGWFQVGAQLMLRLDNGGGALGDVSYLAPDECGYATANYWRFTLHGSNGQAETSATDTAVTIYTHAGKSAERIPAGPSVKGLYFDGLLAEIRGQTDNLPLSTAEVLESTRICLLAQDAAQRDLRDVNC